MKKNLVFEIGVEELPSPYFDCIYREKDRLADLVKDSGFSFDSFDVFISLRRIVFFIQGLPEVQETKEDVIKGPATDKCYDKDGNPLPALSGFLRSKGVSNLSDTFEIEDGKKKRIAINVVSGGKKTVDVLKDVLPQFLSMVTFPRNMSWNDSGLRFPRPIRWLLCMFGDEVVEVSFAGLTAATKTFGHRYLCPEEILVLSADDYFNQIREHKIFLDENERYHKILNDFISLADKESFSSESIDTHLVRTISRLCEYPYVLSGSFNDEYLKLPADVLATCMKKHQKIFACYDKAEKLVNYFFAVIDGQRKSDDLIRAGYENVLESRLRDAAFFINEDTKRPLATNSKRMNEITFLGNLGTFEDKIKRMSCLCEFVGKKSLFGDSADKLADADVLHLIEAAQLSKVDLVSSIVFEFPELQGIAGREYLKLEGKPAEVYQAVSDHYLPMTLSDDIDVAKYENIRVGALCALLGIVDRVDTLVGAIGSGITISGSEDPYALRRASGGIIKLIRAFKISLSLEDIIDKAYLLFCGQLVVAKDEFKQRIMNLLKDRVIYDAAEPAGSLERMILDAVLETSCDDIADVFLRHQVLKEVALGDYKDCFVKTVKMIERTFNIGKSFKGTLNSELNEAVLSKEEEINLFRAYQDNQKEIQSLCCELKYKEATIKFYHAFHDVVEKFFDNVMVNVDDEAVKINRLTLLSKINKLYTCNIADLSKVNGL